MAKRVKTNYDRGYVNAMDKIRVFIESSSKVMYVDLNSLNVREWCMENDISLGQFDRWLYGALRKSDTPSRVKPKEPWPYRVVAGLNRVLEILLDSILEDFICRIILRSL